jgi:ABC-type nitrate/sulfonate/bicarbonate transport system ATPase subunit
MVTKSEVLLDVKNVSLALGGNQILRDISFNVRNVHRTGVEQGQVIALLGKSGIGKTQLFNILAGLQTPDSGDVLVNSTLAPVNSGDMGVVFQDYYIDYWRKVEKLLFKAVSKNPKIKPEEHKDAVMNMAAQFDIIDHLKKWPGMLSGGQKQRVAIAEQLLLGGNFLLLDEPFSGLDVFVIDKVINTLLKITTTDELKTLIIVSHDLTNTVAISDTVFVLNKQEGKPGATIVKEIDLITLDLAYHDDIKNTSLFRDTLLEIKNFMQ